MDDQIKKTLNSLKQKQFDAHYFVTANDAKDYILSMIANEATVGMGGSMTIQSLDLNQGLSEKRAVILNHHAPGLTYDEKMAILRKQLTCDVFLTSSNALTEEGQLLNIDGTGNRVAAMTFGPQKVLVVVGKNKILTNLAAAYERAKNTAAQRNNERLGTKNPCVTQKHCVNCQGDTRICRIISVMERKPLNTNISVLIIDDVLGY